VCGNDKCEQYETCSICPQDCGACEAIGCMQVVQCAFQCIDVNADPPTFSVSCVANCVALGCAKVQFFVDQVLTCAAQHLPECGGDFGCLQNVCGAEIAACIGATCPAVE
jgi:hypothetical protein